jgi:hypothetical protein
VWPSCHVREQIRGGRIELVTVLNLARRDHILCISDMQARTMVRLASSVGGLVGAMMGYHADGLRKAGERAGDVEYCEWHREAEARAGSSGSPGASRTRLMSSPRHVRCPVARRATHAAGRAPRDRSAQGCATCPRTTPCPCPRRAAGRWACARDRAARHPHLPPTRLLFPPHNPHRDPLAPLTATLIHVHAHRNPPFPRIRCPALRNIAHDSHLRGGTSGSGEHDPLRLV